MKIEIHVGSAEDGYGIELSIVKQVSEIHGGKTDVLSKVGRASTFKISRPDAHV